MSVIVVLDFKTGFLQLEMAQDLALPALNEALEGVREEYCSTFVRST